MIPFSQVGPKLAGEPHLFRQLFILIALFGVVCSEINNPSIIDPIAPQIVNVGQTLIVPLSARDPDGDPITFTATPRPATAIINKQNGQWSFEWAPLISDTGPGGKLHHITIHANDGRGGSTGRVMEVNVQPQVGAPVFIGPQGYVLNLSEDDDISIVISVKDDDSKQVYLRSLTDFRTQMQGAKFQVLDGKSASFYWRPTKEQIAMGNYWQIVVGAKDETHNEVLREYSILLMNADAAKSCKGTAPDIDHVPVKDFKAASVIVFQTYARDFDSNVREVTLHYATNNPLDPKSYEGNKIKMIQCDPSNDPSCPQGRENIKNRYYLGTLLNPGSQSSVPLMLYYYITAVDNDDIKGTTCDLESRLPKEGHFGVALYPAGWAGGCKDDALEPNNTMAQARILSPGVTHDLRNCVGTTATPDWYQLDIMPGSIISAELIHAKQHGELRISLHNSAGNQIAPALDAPPGNHVVAAPAQSPVFVQVNAPGGSKLGDQTYSLVINTTQGSCENDKHEPNDQPFQAPLQGIGTLETTVCPGDRDWFQIQVQANQTVVADLEFQHGYGDLDLYLYASDGTTLLASSETASSDERVLYNATSFTTVYLEVRGFQGAINTADLSLIVTPTASLCFEDTFSPNHVIDAAILLPENAYGPLRMCANKEDWFRLDINDGEELVILALPAEVLGGIIKLDVFHDKNGLLPVGQTEYQLDTVINTSTRMEAGTIWWRTSTSGIFTFPYYIQFWVQDPGGPCLEDRYFPNTTTKSAVQVPNELGFVTRLKMCPGNDDWFKIKSKAFEELFVYVFGFSDEIPQLQASLYRYQGENLVLVDSGTPTSNGVELLTLPETNEDYFIKVEGPGVIVYHYDLVIGVQ